MDEAADNDFLVVTFSIQDSLIGIRSSEVEEIVRIPPITHVPNAPPYVLGIVNLRGRILTILDISNRLGLGVTAAGDDSRILIVTVKGESMGVLVPQLSDVVEIGKDEIKPMSGSVLGASADHFLGLFEKDDRLIALLDPEATLMAP